MLNNTNNNNLLGEHKMNSTKCKKITYFYCERPVKRKRFDWNVELDNNLLEIVKIKTTPKINITIFFVKFHSCVT